MAESETVEPYVPFVFNFPVIVRLETKSGKTYELGQHWPDPFHVETTSPVSFIIERSETTETTSSKDEDEDDEDSDYDEERSPHHYEVWAMHPAFAAKVGEAYSQLAMSIKTVEDLARQSAVFSENITQVLKALPGVRCREILAHDVSYVEKEVPMGQAWPTIKEFFEEASGVIVEHENQPGPPQQPVQQQAAAPNGG